MRILDHYKVSFYSISIAYGNLITQILKDTRQGILGTRMRWPVTDKKIICAKHGHNVIYI